MNPLLPPVRACFAALAVATLAATTAFAAPIPTPSEYLRLDIGADRVLADYRQIRSYFGELDRLSPRVQLQTLGKSTLGEDMVMAVITSEANMARLPRLKEIAAKLADPRGLSDAQIAALTEEGRAFLLITCNIHATEIGSTQMAMEWAHALAGGDDAETKRRLDEVVLLLVPSLNPDGQIMETEWYRKHLGTPYEGGRQPWL
ncbi:MAG: peptidase M14, partial [Candidatus Eisenbacteria bacterium]|nr:peptidase M14 [Candidatus Eisenbacteria bacterium]